MISLQAPPHPALQRYIAQYTYVSFNSSELPSLKQTFLPIDIPSITIFTGPGFSAYEREYVINPVVSNGSSVVTYYTPMITSPTSLFFKENVLIKGFVIMFKSAGFSDLFHMNVAELTNQLPDFLLFSKASAGSRFLDQLAETSDFKDQIAVLDRFFLNKVSCHYKDASQVGEACRRLIVSNGLICIKDLAYHTNMSVKTLERHFTEKVGVPPKVFARFKRLHHALCLMNRQHVPSWASIAYECGYYDQNHFIKEFKSFSQQLPSAYMPQEYLLYNHMLLFRNFLPY